jgi:acyl-CoA thioesterase-1
MLLNNDGNPRTDAFPCKGRAAHGGGGGACTTSRFLQSICVMLRSLPALLAQLFFLAAPGLAATEPRPLRLLVLGDSLAAGFGVDPDQAYPARLGRRAAAAGLSVEVVNGGVSGDTTAGGLRRLSWLLREPPDVLLLALGGNDGLRGLPPEATRSNLLAIVDRARAGRPGLAVVLAGMQMPPNMGDDYTRQFSNVFPAVARGRGLPLVPHLLEGVGGRPELNLPDGIHPTSEGHAVIASNIWPVLEPVLRGAAETPAARAGK